jgi:hypothetical protein
LKARLNDEAKTSVFTALAHSSLDQHFLEIQFPLDTLLLLEQYLQQFPLVVTLSVFAALTESMLPALLLIRLLPYLERSQSWNTS